jgi:hypothetical protein
VPEPGNGTYSVGIPGSASKPWYETTRAADLAAGLAGASDRLRRATLSMRRRFLDEIDQPIIADQR